MHAAHSWAGGGGRGRINQRRELVGGAGVRVPRLHALTPPTVELEAVVARGMHVWKWK